MSMMVGENFRKFSTLIRNSLIIFSRKLFDGNIYVHTRSIKSIRGKKTKSKCSSIYYFPLFFLSAKSSDL